MSRNIETRIGTFEEIKKGLAESFNIEDTDLLEKILLSFGDKVDTKYVILLNEAFEEDNSFNELVNFIDKYYQVEGSISLLLKLTETGTCNNNAYEVAEQLGLELSEDKQNLYDLWYEDVNKDMRRILNPGNRIIFNGEYFLNSNYFVEDEAYKVIDVYEAGLTVEVYRPSGRLEVYLHPDAFSAFYKED